MRVMACVVNWNTAHHLPGVLAALRSQTHSDLDVVVVDNASTDGSAQVVREQNVRLIANHRNRGFAGAANQGATCALAAEADALVLCNPDVRPEPDYVSRALAALAVDPRRASVQGKLWRFPAVPAVPDAPVAHVLDTTGHLAFRTRLFRNRGEGEVDSGQFDLGGEIFGVSGALAVYRMAALDDVACDGEIFDEDLFAFWEDIDLDWRFALRGWAAAYEPCARAYHERGGAGPRRSAFVERLNFVNRFLVVLKNDDSAALARALPGVTLTTTLKAGELALTVPSAFLGSFGAMSLIGPTLRRRRIVQRTAAVDPGAVVRRWFEPFDYAAWVRTWWQRVR